MKMLGRKYGRMTAFFEKFTDPFLVRSSKWCHSVLVITRITKLMGMFRLKIICGILNGKSMYDHSGTKIYIRIKKLTELVLKFSST